MSPATLIADQYKIYIYVHSLALAVEKTRQFSKSKLLGHPHFFRTTVAMQQAMNIP